MIAVCCALADAAIARGSTVCGTMSGRIAWMVGISKARATPTTNRNVNIASRVSQPPTDPKRAHRGRGLPTWVMAMTLRRS